MSKGEDCGFGLRYEKKKTDQQIRNKKDFFPEHPEMKLKKGQSWSNRTGAD